MLERKFEIITKDLNKDIHLPCRATKYSAGYDIEASRDIIIPSIWTPSLIKYFKDYYETIYDDSEKLHLFQNSVATTLKPTLVPTGIKVQMPKDNYLKLYSRSSGPLKRYLILANGVGIIDSDYYNNPNNEGEIFGQFLNFSPEPYTIYKGDRIMQGIFEQYLLTANDQSGEKRTGGFGSTK